MAFEIKQVVNQSVKKGADSCRRALKSNPSETKLTAAGAATGLGVGIAIGGSIGLAAFGGAIGIPIAAIGLVGGTIVGNRIGIARDKKELDKRLSIRDDILSKLLAERDSKNIKPITTNEEHRTVLFEAMDKAVDTLVILSGWATSFVVDSAFQKALAKCLDRGTNVYIGYGYKASHEPKPKKAYEVEAIQNLKSLQDWCNQQQTKGHLIVRYYPNHVKLLICDEKFAVNGSFNWLSNAGRSVNEERSWIVYDREFISTELDIVIGGLMSPLKSTRRDILKIPFPWSDR